MNRVLRQAELGGQDPDRDLDDELTVVVARGSPTEHLEYGPGSRAELAHRMEFRITHDPRRRPGWIGHVIGSCSGTRSEASQSWVSRRPKRSLPPTL